MIPFDRFIACWRAERKNIIQLHLKESRGKKTADYIVDVVKSRCQHPVNLRLIALPN